MADKPSVTTLVVIACTALFFHGCGRKMELQCVWPSDMRIRDCNHRSFNSCIKQCTNCTTHDGENDDCNQLKCSAFCAKRDGSASCLSNFEQLCKWGKESLKSPKCDVLCSSARTLSSSIMVILGVLTLWYAPLKLFVAGALIAGMFHLQGCGSLKTGPHLDWEPDWGSLKSLARWYDGNGIWRGNPSFSFSPMLDTENSTCTTREAEGYCSVWTVNEFKQKDKQRDFGVCKCKQSSDNEKYCKSWTCHSLQAKQQKCHYRGKYRRGLRAARGGRSRGRSSRGRSSGQALLAGIIVGSSNKRWMWKNYCYTTKFPMTQKDYVGLLKGQMREDGERDDAWFVSKSIVNISNATWPPRSAQGKKWLFRDDCIVNSANAARARYFRCKTWRVVDTKLRNCWCAQSNKRETHCTKWKCEDKAIGMFAILFRTNNSLAELTEGVKTETYECKKVVKNKCNAWEGSSVNLDAATTTRCECQGDKCDKWLCDEYSYLLVGPWSENPGRIIVFAFFFATLACVLLSADPASVLCYAVVIFLPLTAICIVSIGFCNWIYSSAVFFLACGVSVVSLCVKKE